MVTLNVSEQNYNARLTFSKNIWIMITFWGNCNQFYRKLKSINNMWNRLNSLTIKNMSIADMCINCSYKSRFNYSYPYGICNCIVVIWDRSHFPHFIFALYFTIVRGEINSIYICDHWIYLIATNSKQKTKKNLLLGE